MATPNAQIQRGAPLKVGILLGVSPSSDPTFDVEIVRATSSGVYSTVGRLTNLSGGVQPTFEDLLPYTTQTFSYKARAVKQGWLAGDYTAVVSARPLPMPEILPKITPLTGRGIGANLYQSTGVAVTYGRASTQAYYTKTLRILGTAVQPGGGTISYDFNSGGGIRPSTGTGSTAYNYQLVVPLPPEAIVTGYSLLYRRNAATRKLRCTLYSVSTNGTPSTKGDILNPTTDAGVAFTTSTSVTAFTVGNAANILFRIGMYTTAGAGNSVAVERVDVDYKIPNLNRTL